MTAAVSKIVMRRALTVVLALAAAMSASGCLVLSVNPAYDDTTIAWDQGLIGHWIDADDKSSLVIERGEWRSYRIHYEHPIETGDLTGYLTIVGDERYLDVMPARGQDRGSFLIPVHAVLRVRLKGDTLELSPLSYDWFAESLRAAKPIAGLDAALDQKENALITTPTSRLREWLRLQDAAGPAVGAGAVFTRK
jgi:hypothetical protein